MNKDEKFGNRTKRQADEKAETVSTDLPTDRFQGEKQVLTPDQLGGAGSPVAGTSGKDTRGTAARVIKDSLSVRPSTDVEMLEGKQVGGVPLGTSAVTRSAAGASQGIAASDDTSKIPYQAGNYRPTTRYGKKRSEDLFELDNTVSEQIVPLVEDSKDLRDAPDAKMGYNGRHQFKEVRGKKNYVGLPQTLLYEGSADYHIHHHIIHTTGQVIDGVDPQAGYPTRTYDLRLENDIEKGWSDIDAPMVKANYLLRGLSVTTDGTHITGITFDEVQIPVPAASIARDMANFNWQVDANNVTKSVIRLQQELGRETTDKWSPLGYVIEQPYQFNMLIHDIEATTGALSALAYRSAVSSLSAQRNIISKDGIGTEAAAIRMFADGCLGSLADSTIVNGVGITDGVFNRGLYQLGSAAGLIEMFDSVNKYRTKADLLGLQRSLPLHLSQADNNIDPLRVKAEFMKVMDKAHTYSTTSGSYNPLLPIHATGTVGVMNPLSLQYFLKGWVNPHTTTVDPKTHDPETGLPRKYTYQYADIRNSYFWTVTHPLVAGIVKWLLRHEGAFCRVFGGEVYMPANFHMMAPSLFSFVICSASQLTLMERNRILRDVLFAGEQSEYVYHDLITLKDADPLHSTQLTIQGYNQDLILGKLAPDTALRYMWADTSSLLNYDDGGLVQNAKATYMMPWYMSEAGIKRGSDPFTLSEGWFDSNHPHYMSIPSIRCGLRHEYVDIIKSMEENDVRLAMDRMIDIPQPRVYTADELSSTVPIAAVRTTSAGNINDETKVRAVRYDNNSDGRLIVQYDLVRGVATNGYMNGYAFLGTPKELGWLWSSPFGTVITSISFSSGRDSASRSVETEGSTHGYQDVSTTSFEEVRSYRVYANAFTDGSIDRSAALNQVYRTAFSPRMFAAENEAYTQFCGISLNSSYGDLGYENVDNVLLGIGSTRPTSGVNAFGNMKGFATMARTFWSTLQRFFRPVNSFENCYDEQANLEYPTDPCECSFYFGVCGFLASDYSQAALERLDIFDQLGLDYTEDVFIKESLLFR